MFTPTFQAPFPPLVLSLGHAPATPLDWDLGIPVLAGEKTETLFPGAKLWLPAPAGLFTLFIDGDFLLGVAQCPITAGLCNATKALYEQLLDLVGANTLCRIWNYVPAINKNDSTGLEHYRSFCLGRSQAFESTHGNHFEPRLCAASAVGTDSPLLTIAFASHKTASLAYENPLQMPAYAYPSCYGPRPPSFARASVVPLKEKRHHVFISGTAAIRGHQTVGLGDTKTQLLCTIENLEAIGECCGLGTRLATSASSTRWFKVYIRHAQDLELVQSVLNEKLLQASDRVSYLRSDICRADLLVEIELSVL